MPYTLKPDLGSPVTIESAARRDVLLSRGWVLVEDEPTEETAPKPRRTRAKATDKTN